MQHPFTGILAAGRQQSPSEINPGAPQVLAKTVANRRTFLARIFGITAGVIGAWSARVVSAQRIMIPGRESDAGGGSSPQGRMHSGSSDVTTQALGEEGGGSGTVTTYAIGEEGGGYPPGRWNPPPSGPITTQAIGEEGGRGFYPRYRWRPPASYYRPPSYYYPPPGRQTTQAVGEEGGWWH